MRWIFYLPSNFGEKVLDPEYPENHPMGGSETVTILLAAKLRELGHEAIITTDAAELATIEGDILVITRDYIVFTKVTLPRMPRILWCHDDTDQEFLAPLRDPEVANYFFSQCNKIVVPSHYAAQKWATELHAPIDKIEVIANAVATEKFILKNTDWKTRQRNAYYASTPQRGLEYALKMWDLVTSRISEAQLFVAGSTKTYHREENEAELKLYELTRQTKGTVVLGAIPQKELRKVALDCRALAYPSIFAETGCIVAMEAMAAGCAIVTTRYGAMPETAWLNPTVMMQGNWLDTWIDMMLMVLYDDSCYAKIAERNRELSQWMTYDGIAKDWIHLSMSILSPASQKLETPRIAALARNPGELKKILSVWHAIQNLVENTSLEIICEDADTFSAAEKLLANGNVALLRIEESFLPDQKNTPHILFLVSNFNTGAYLARVMQSGCILIGPVTESLRALTWRNQLIPPVGAWEQEIPTRIFRIARHARFLNKLSEQNKMAGNLLARFIAQS